MTDTTDIFKQSMDQVTALTQSWLKAPNLTPAAQSGAQMQRLTSLASDLQGLYAEAYQRHLDPFLTGNRKIAEHFAALTRSRNPQDFADFQLEIMGLVMEGASVRAEIWGELADKLGRRYAEFARELAADMQPALGEADGQGAKAERSAAPADSGKRVPAKTAG